METNNKLIKLVGLQYYLSIEQRKEFFKTGNNTSILIKPDKENLKDRTALEAFDEDWNKIANVSMQDKYIVWMVIFNSAEKYVNAHVERIDTDKNYLYVSIDDIDLSNIERQFTNKKFENLHISCPILPHPESVACLHLAFLQAKNKLENIIIGKTEDKRKIYTNIKYFIENYYSDISIDADIERQTLIDLLKRTNDPDYEFFIDKLNYIGTHKGSIITKAQKFGDWMMRVEKSNMDKLVKLKYDDLFVEKVKMELSEFPNDLYDVYLQRPNDFLSNVYYSCLSREVIAMLFSGIIFIDANENRNIDKHLNTYEDINREDLFCKEVINIPQQINENNKEKTYCGIRNNKEVFIDCVNKSINDKSLAIIWRVLYSVLKSHHKFGYDGSLKDYYNNVCVGLFNVDLTYNAISKSKGRYSFYIGDDLIEKKVRDEFTVIDNFYNYVEEYFKSKINDYIN